MNRKLFVGIALTFGGLFGLGYAVKKTYDNVLDDRKRFIPQDDELPAKEESRETEQVSEIENDVLVVSDEKCTPCQQSQDADALTKFKVAYDISNHVVMPTVNMLVKALMKNQTFFYGSTSSSGYVTGFGYVFETIIRHSTINGHRPVKQSDTYHGADFQVGEKQYQAKCCCISTY